MKAAETVEPILPLFTALPLESLAPLHAAD
jgi:hypothetical protein